MDDTDDFDFVTADDHDHELVFRALDRNQRTDIWFRNVEEEDADTEIWDPDSDDDGLTDGQEVHWITQADRGNLGSITKDFAPETNPHEKDDGAEYRLDRRPWHRVGSTRRQRKLSSVSETLDSTTPTMSDSTTEQRDRFPTGEQLPLVAAALAYLVAVVHLAHPSHGFPRLALILAADPGLLLADPRPLAFVLSGFAILVAVPAVLRGVPKRPIYALGAGLMIVYLAGYFAWHLSGHGGFLPGRKPLYHGLAPHEALISHLTTDPWAATAFVLEVALLVVLVLLLHRQD